MSSARKSRLRAFSGCYRVWTDLGRACAYCGVAAETYDHVPNLAMLHALGIEHYQRRKIQLWKVPACRECNVLLSDCAATSIPDRRAQIKAKLKARYAKLLAMPSWTDREIADLGIGLQDVIEDANAVRSWIKRRLEW